jgi:hypothetical protein
MAAISRAQPSWPQRSGRWVMAWFSITITVSPIASASRSGVPTRRRASSTMMPSWELPSSSSSSAQIMPSLASPRSTTGLMVRRLRVPSRPATLTVRADGGDRHRLPGRHIGRTADDAQRLRQRRCRRGDAQLVCPGCGLQVRTRPTTTPSRAAPVALQPALDLGHPDAELGLQLAWRQPRSATAEEAFDPIDADAHARSGPVRWHAGAAGEAPQVRVRGGKQGPLAGHGEEVHVATQIVACLGPWNSILC